MEVAKQNTDLQRINAKQSKQLGKMGKLEDKLNAYKSTVAMQEKVSRILVFALIVTTGLLFYEPILTRLRIFVY